MREAKEPQSRFGNMKIRTKIIVPTVLILVLSNLMSLFTSAYKMDDLAKTNEKIALNQLTDSIFLNLRTAMNTGDSTIIADAEEKSRKHIQGLEKFTVARSQNMIELFSPQITFTNDTETLKAFGSKKETIIESFENDKHFLRSLRPMIATEECVHCHVNQQIGDVIGVLDLTFNLKDSDEIINSTVKNLVFQAVTLLIFITLFMTWLVRRATKPIDVFQRGLEMFFKFINKEEKHVGYIDGYSHDEIGSLVDSVNKNIDLTVQGVKKDEAVIQEAKEVCKQASIGIYNVEIKVAAHSPEINELKDLINQLISSTGHNIIRVGAILNKYDQNNYQDRISSKGTTAGSMKEVFDKVDALGDSLTKNAKTNLQNGQTLQNDANTLENSVGYIKVSLDQQSNELENSVKELEQITNTIRETTSNAIAMDSYAKSVTSSVLSGQTLANRTSKEMDEIATQVNAISTAIAIIDQIAFQTNILSLNAAVEAATAGEAGKGFAVVAQEVRNLANRSADAAREIKILVESASQKANEGKKISDEMTNGYGDLNNQISETIKLIHNVTNASKNQQSSIEHINKNISSIKENTVKSAEMVEKASRIAIETNTLAAEIVNEAMQKKF
ncbi:MAG: methyl-accepting chemotaxis protein [Arcobacter sp.]|nr:methyl-accepting chemotaxis protein [Arcobacter sp.]